MSGLVLVLARHGRTEANVARMLDTRPPGYPLDDVGAAQALALADELGGLPVVAVYASTALRAQQTAAPIAAGHGLDVGILDGVHEVSAGELEGRFDEDALLRFNDMFAAWRDGRLDEAIPGGESAQEVRGRFLVALDTVVGRHQDGVVVLVSHGAAIRLVAAALIGDHPESRYLHNVGRVVLEADPAEPTGWRLQSWDTAAPVPGDVTGGATAEA